MNLERRYESDYDLWLKRKTAVLDERYNAGFSEGAKAGFLSACILCGAMALIAVAAVWGW